MPVVVLFLAYNVLIIAADQYGRWKHRQDPVAHPLPRRLTTAQLWNFGTRQVVFIALLWYAHSVGDWTLESVGVPPSARWLDSILAGELAFLALILVYSLSLRLSGRMESMRFA